MQHVRDRSEWDSLDGLLMLGFLGGTKHAPLSRRRGEAEAGKHYLSECESLVQSLAIGGLGARELAI